MGTYMNLLTRNPNTQISTQVPIEEKDHDYIIIIQFKGVMAGVLVKKIYGQLDAVIKPFEDVMKTTEGFRGTTLLGDDRIAYVISEEQLFSKLEAAA
jgi:chemotaxis protein histidine kinase CheA